MLHTKFHENRPGLEKKIFEGFLPYMGMVAILVMTSIMSSYFHFLVPESFHTKFSSE